MNHDPAGLDKPVSPNPGPDAGEADSPLIRRFRVALAADEMAREIDRLAAETSRTVKMPGFRQGKVPVDVVRKVHLQALREEVIHKAVGRLAYAHIERERLAIAGEPALEKLDDPGDGGFQADIAVEVFPEFELPDLPGLRVEVQAAALKGEAYDEAQQVDRVLEAHKRSQPAPERAAAAGDLVLLAIQSADAASRRKWPRQQTYFLMDAAAPAEIPGLYDALLGKKAGEAFALRAAYPDDAAKKAWAGKEIEHQVEVKTVFEMKKPALDEEFLKTLGMKSVEEFQGRLRQEYERHQQQRRNETLLSAVFDKLLEACRFPVPRALQEQELAQRLSQARQPLRFASEEEKNRFRDTLLEQAEKSVRLSLILEKVRQQQRLEVGDADLENEYARLAREHGAGEAEIRRYYGDEKRAAELKHQVLQARINGWLLENVKVSEV